MKAKDAYAALKKKASSNDFGLKDKFFYGKPHFMNWAFMINKII